MIFQVSKTSIQLTEITPTIHPPTSFVKQDVLHPIPFTLKTHSNTLFGDVSDPRFLSCATPNFETQEWTGREYELETGETTIVLNKQMYSELLSLHFNHGKQNITILKSEMDKIAQKPSRNVPHGELIEFYVAGPANTHINIVFMSSGYLSNQKSRFLKNVQDNIDFMKTVSPYDQYLSMMNIYAVWQTSREEGASHPERREYRDTNLDCTYNTNGIERLLTCSTRKILDLARYAPGSDIKIVLVNDPKYGGSGSSIVAISYNGELMREVNIHELGHSAFGLADEYTYGGNGSGRFPNCYHSNTVSNNFFQFHMQRDYPGNDGSQNEEYQELELIKLAHMIITIDPLIV